MDFKTNLKIFESMSAGNNSILATATKSKGPLPAKKPLVSAQDCLKLREDENRRHAINQQIHNSINDHEASPSDTNYEHLLVKR